MRLVLDMDGVVFDTDEIKARTLASLFANAPTEVQSEIDLWNRANRGIPRRDKFEFIADRWRASEPHEVAVADLMDRYQRLLEPALRTASLLPGAELIPTLEVPVHLCSSAPQQDVDSLLERHDLASAFVSASGDPPGKRHALSTIRRQHPTDAITHIGDGRADAMVAAATNVDFIGITRAPKTFDGLDVPTVASLCDFLTRLHQRY